MQTAEGAPHRSSPPEGIGLQVREAKLRTGVPSSEPDQEQPARRRGRARVAGKTFVGKLSRGQEALVPEEPRAQPSFLPGRLRSLPVGGACPSWLGAVLRAPEVAQDSQSHTGLPRALGQRDTQADIQCGGCFTPSRLFLAPELRVTASSFTLSSEVPWSHTQGRDGRGAPAIARGGSALGPALREAPSIPPPHGLCQVQQTEGWSWKPRAGA